MGLSDLLLNLFQYEKESAYIYLTDFDGLNFKIDSKLNAKIKTGKANNWLMSQHVALKMLVEQGDAEIIPNGFIVPSKTCVKLDTLTQELLDFPPKYNGYIDTDIRGITTKNNFRIILSLELPNGKYTTSYKLNGPILEFSQDQKYILSPGQLAIFESAEQHSQSEKSEYDNLTYILTLQEAKQDGTKINLSQFEQLNVFSPETVSIQGETDLDGNLILTPFMGQKASYDRIQKVLGQLKSPGATALRVTEKTALKVNKEIILLDEQKIKAVQEILNNRIIKKKDVKKFLNNPTAYIDASLVDLDVGFSVRVHGVTLFKHAYFGETDESGIDWFGKNVRSEEILSPQKIIPKINDNETLVEFKEKLNNSYQTGANEIEFKGTNYDISNKEQLNKIISDIENKLITGTDKTDQEDSDDKEGGVSEGNAEKSRDETLVIDVDLNDEYIDKAINEINNKITDVLFPSSKLDWSNYKRKPFPHQEIGVCWILGLYNKHVNFNGALLADDMGLGKTFMALSAIEKIYLSQEKSNETKKPCLIVAPLGLIQNWKDEVDKTFKNSPFHDIVLLQSDADLSKFRENRVLLNEADDSGENIAEIRFTLKVGKEFNLDRLDFPQRLVITTYQALRDHQFSLCLVDWGFIVFDEAQNIKNPNTLQTRAAKGLKAEFKLVTTGTPVENSLVDFWCLIDTASPGPKYLGSYQSFRDEYIKPILQAAGDEVNSIRERVGIKLREKIGTLMLRRLKEDNLEGLPEKRIYVGIDDAQWKYLPSLSNVMQNRQLDTYNSIIESISSGGSDQVLAGLQRLRDCSLHPNLVDGGVLKVPSKNEDINKLMSLSGKMSSLIEILNEIKTRGEKCIIFTVNKRLQAFLATSLAKLYGLGILSVINGDAKAVAKRASVKTRITMIKEFENKSGFNIIIMSPIAAGVGLTIVGANNVIHFERHWNPAKEAQATDRVFRIGQKKDVNVYIPILHHPEYDSFDKNIHQLLSKKTLLKDAVVTPEQVIPTPEGFVTKNLNARIAIEDIYRISWQQFEALVAELLLKEYDASNCWLTQSGSDYGADIVLVDPMHHTLVQCKHTSYAKYEGYSAIQEVKSAKTMYDKSFNTDFKKLILATNAKKLSPKTIEMANDYEVEILKYDSLKDLLYRHHITYEMMISRLNKARYKI